MKKLFLPLILTVLVCLPASAQTFKIIGGPVFSSFSNFWPNPEPLLLLDSSNLNPFQGHKTGVFGGLGVEIPLSKKLSLEVNGFYKESGNNYRWDYWVTASYMYKNKIQELSIPVLFKAHFLRSPWPYFLVGGNFSFILSNDFSVYYRAQGSSDFEKTDSYDEKDSTARNNLGAVFGLGFEVPGSKGKMSIEARYELGVKDLLENHQGYRQDVKTRQFILVFGLKI